jgi:anti-sigma factor ChrR (cupin superfamily)
VVLLKLQPGWKMDAHSHVYAEMHYVLEGEYESGSTVYPAGSFRLIPAHTDHGPFVTTKGALILGVWFE